MSAACGLVIACGSRSSIQPCAFGPCEDGAGPGEAGAAGAGATGGSTAGGRAGAGGGAGSAGAGAGGVGEGGSGGLGVVAGAAGNGGVAGLAGAGGAPPEEPPIVVLLVDASFSMFQSDVWAPTFEALTGPGGPLERYQQQIRLGFASYRGSGRSNEDDLACADITQVPLALDNSAQIRETYGALTTRRGYFETPTGHALARVSAALLTEPPAARKYILLFSDGAPDTCLTTKPQCGQDRAVSAVQSAQRSGIETLAIGIGYGTEYDCNPSESRCGKDHFQDLANAGRGYPVQAPPDPYITLPCAAETGGALLAEYAPEGGAAAFAWAGDAGEVRSAVESILAEIVAR